MVCFASLRSLKFESRKAAWRKRYLGEESRQKSEAKVPLDLAHSTAVDLRAHLASPLQAYPRHEVLYTKMAQNKRTRRF